MTVVSAAPVTMETLRYFQSINIPLYELYGMSECTGPMTVSIPGHIVSGSCGIAMDGTEMKLINEDEDGNGEVSSNFTRVVRGIPKGVGLEKCKRIQNRRGGEGDCLLGIYRDQKILASLNPSSSSSFPTIPKMVGNEF